MFWLNKKSYISLQSKFLLINKKKNNPLIVNNYDRSSCKRRRKH